jgi:ATP-binding cassette subfamily F protein 3
MLYQVSKAAKYYGAETVFEDCSFEIRGTEKIAIVGRNGCGKTTFLRCMCGEENFDRGAVSRQNGITIGYLAQKVLEHDERTVEDELMLIYRRVFDLQERMNDLEAQMADSADEKILNQYARLQEEFEAAGGYSWESEMKTVFTRFGFDLSDLKKKIGEFSGGQKTRIAFVRLLLSKPDILLLDEPTNHLDLAAIEWLEGYVKNYPKAVVVVSHDRMFLDRVVDCVVDMEYGKMKRYSGSYSSFTIQKENDLDRLQQAYERQQKDIQRLQALIEKFRYKKNKAAFAQSKIKYLDRMEKIEVEKADTKTFHAKFTPAVKGGERVLDVDHLKIGYDVPLCEVSLEMHRGNRIGVIGANGTGKSTFVKTLMGLVPPLSGSFLYGHQIECGYFDQQLAQFSSGKTVLEELWDENPELDRTAVRSVLGQFLFSADDVFKTVDVLSGGEKVRLSLAKLLLKHSNLLILDEPTNHLDIPGKEALEESLRGFTGSILFVSHDRYFINQLADRLLILDDEGAEFFEGNYQEYSDLKKAQETVQKAEQPAKSAAKSEKKTLSPEGRRRQLAATEKKITEKENRLEECRSLRFEPEYYEDFEKMNTLEKEIAGLEEEIAALMDEWEALSEG